MQPGELTEPGRNKQPEGAQGGVVAFDNEAANLAALEGRPPAPPAAKE